jgi:uncharacterized protein (TIGR02391 family)
MIYIGSKPHGHDQVRNSGALTRHLSTQHELKLIGGIYRSNSRALRGRSPVWAWPADELDEVDVVYMEGGWNDDEGDLIDPDGLGRGDRLPLELAKSFVRRGGQLIVADVDQNVYDDQRHSLAQAADLFGAVVVEFDDSNYARLLHDDDARVQGGTQFFPSQMHVSDWLKPALEGIDSILTDYAILLKPEEADIAASGNASTTIWMVESHPVEGRILPWASVNKYGRGHAVLLGGAVSNQAGFCPDNATWISNLIALLTERSRRFPNLHPSISAVSAEHFANGHYDEAVFAAFKAVEHRVQTLTGSSDSGKTLMAKIFDEKSATLDIAHDNTNHRQKADEAEGFKFLFMGAMQGLRNPRAHGAHLQTYWPEAMEMLVTASMLMRALDRAEKRMLSEPD